MESLCRLLQWPTRAGVIVIMSFLGLVSFATIALADPPHEHRIKDPDPASGFELPEELQDTTVLLFDSYIRKFVGRAPKWPPNKKVVRRAPDIARITVRIAREYGIDPRVSAVVMRTESGFRESIPGEKDDSDWGIMQIHRPYWQRKLGDIDLQSTEGQIEAGHVILQEGYLKCDGTHTQALTYYSTGQCQIPSSHRKYTNVRHRLILLARLGVDPSTF